MKLNFQKNKGTCGETPFFVKGQFCTSHSICLKISSRQGSFVWKCCVFNRSTFKQKRVLQFSKKRFSFPKNLSQS